MLSFSDVVHVNVCVRVCWRVTNGVCALLLCLLDSSLSPPG